MPLVYASVNNVTEDHTHLDIPMPVLSFEDQVTRSVTKKLHARRPRVYKQQHTKKEWIGLSACFGARIRLKARCSTSCCDVAIHSLGSHVPDLSYVECSRLEMKTCQFFEIFGTDKDTRTSGTTHLRMTSQIDFVSISHSSLPSIEKYRQIHNPTRYIPA